MLSLAVSRRALKVAVEATRKRVPIAAGITACGLRDAVSRMRMAESTGVDLLFSAEPYYYKLNMSELVSYYVGLANASSLPMVVYHRPTYWPGSAATAASLPNSFGRLAAHPKIVGMKDVTQDFRDYQRLVFHLGCDGFGILTAAGRLLLASLAIGGHGGAIPEAALAPKHCVSLYNAFRAGDLARAQAIQRQLAPLGDALAAQGAFTGAAAMKEGLRLLGLCESRLVQPLQSLDDPRREALAAALRDLELQLAPDRRDLS